MNLWMNYVVELFEHEMNHFVLQVNGKCKIELHQCRRCKLLVRRHGNSSSVCASQC